MIERLREVVAAGPLVSEVEARVKDKLRVRMIREATVLPFGAFFGRAREARDVGGFSLARLRPTVPEREVVRHTHEEAHFVFVTGGTYLCSALGAPRICDSPALVYNPPGTTHRDRFLSDSGLFVTISVTRATLLDAGGSVRLPEQAVFLGREVVARARRLRSLAWVTDDADALTLESLCIELLLNAARTAELPRRAAPRWLRHARALLHDESTERHSIASIASTLEVHPIHLTRAFRHHFRMTPGDYLRRCRLERAAALLAETRLPIAEVALASGFCDQSHLNRAFRIAFRMTPGSYRERGRPLCDRPPYVRSVQDASASRR